MLNKFISIWLVVTILHQISVKCENTNAQDKDPNDVMPVGEKLPDNDEIGMKFLQNIFLHLARNPKDKNVAAVKAFLKILIAQKQREERMKTFWNLRHG